MEKEARKVALLFAVFGGLLPGQQAPPSLHVTASTLSATVSSAMFGRLPKSITAVEVLICSDSSADATVPLARIAQKAKPNGYTILTPDVALSVIAAAQGRSKKATALRWGVATVELGAVAATWSGLSSTIKNTVQSSALIGQSSLSIVSTAVPTHTYLSLQTESLPDPLQISAGGCARPGVVLVESDSSAKSVEFDVPLPR